MKYFYPEYEIAVEAEIVVFKEVTSLSAEEKIELAKLYAHTFNLDNKQLIQELGIQGKSLPEGIWEHQPYTLEAALEIIEEFCKPEYKTIVAFGYNLGTLKIIGAFIMQKRSKEHFDSRNYLAPFKIPNDSEYWDEIDVFRRDVLNKDGKIKNFTGIMREKLLQNNKISNPILLFSSTNNPNMVKSWENNGFTVIERKTSFGNNYQSFKLITI